MRTILLIIILLTFVNVQGQNQLQVKKAIVTQWIIYQGDTLAVASVSGDTLFIVKGAELDTLITGGAKELEELTDVDLTTPDSQDILMFDDESNLWKNRTLYQLYDSMQQAVASAPTVYSTWVRDTTKAAMYQATLTDKVGIGTNSPLQTLDVRGQAYFFSDNNPVDGDEPFNFICFIDSADANHYGVRSLLRLQNDSPMDYKFAGGLFETDIDTNMATFVKEVRGAYGYVQHHGTGEVESVKGFHSVIANRSSGTIDYGYGFFGEFVDNAAGGTVDKYYGIYLTDPGENITTKYGRM